MGRREGKTKARAKWKSDPKHQMQKQISREIQILKYCTARKNLR